MTQMPDSEVAAHLADSKLRKRRGWRFLWMLLGGLGLIMLAVAVVGYLAWQAHGRRFLRDEIAAIQASGEPFTTAELIAWQSQPLPERDITAIWQAALAPLSTTEYELAAHRMPLSSEWQTDWHAKKPLDLGPLPQIDSVQDFVLGQQVILRGLHAAAKEPGVVRFPRNYAVPAELLPREPSQIQAAIHALDLSFQHQLREQDATTAIEQLRTQLAVGDVLRNDPTSRSLSARYRAHITTLANIQLLAELLPLTDSQLVDLQQLVRQMDTQQQYEDEAILTRAKTYQMFHIPFAELQSDPSIPMARSIETTTEIGGVSRPEDCAMSMKILSRSIELSRMQLHDAIAAARQEDRSIAELGQPQSFFRYKQTMTSLFAPLFSCLNHASWLARRDMTDCLLAMRRYELKHGQPPDKLTALAPDFIPQLPVDPYSGLPLVLKSSPEGIILYGFGFDGRDDDGLMDRSGREPDVVLPYRPLTRAEQPLTTEP